MQLVEDLIQLSRMETGRNIDVVVTGLRAGKKLNEELFSRADDVDGTARAKILMMPFEAVSPGA